MRRVRPALITLSTSPLSPSITSRYLRSPEVLEVEGCYTHPPSALSFPVRAGSFRRSLIHRYDSEGLDVGVGYDLAVTGSLVTATVYVSPAPALVSIDSHAGGASSARVTLSRREFEICKSEILQAHADAQTNDEGEFVLEHGGLSIAGRCALFEFDDVFAGRWQPLRSQLYVFPFVRRQWTVKYRFTCPRALDVSWDTERFMRGVPAAAAVS